MIRHAGATLTGIGDLQGKISVPVVICGSGPTLKEFDKDWIPKNWVVVAVNEAIKKLGERADYWVLSDGPIVHEYAVHCPQSTIILAMRDAAITVGGSCQKNTIYTTQSEAKIDIYDDGVRFFSRGTVLIGAIEMLRYMGAKKFFCFGLDCYRTKEAYYYDDRNPPLITERKFLPQEMTQLEGPDGGRFQVWVTSRLKRMIVKLQEVRESGMWEKVEIYCVNSPYSMQDSIPKMTIAEFNSIKGKSKKRKKSHGQGSVLGAGEKEQGSEPGKSESNVDSKGERDISGSPDSDVESGESSGDKPKLFVRKG